MKCTNCNEELEVEVGFCPSCGQSAKKDEGNKEDDIFQSTTVDVQEDKKIDIAQKASEAMGSAVLDVKEQGIKIKPVFLAVLVGVLFAIIMAVSFMFKPTTIDLTEFVVAEFSGYEGFGEVKAYLDEEKLVVAVKDAAQNKGDDLDAQVYQAIKGIGIRYDNTADLSSGDKVIVEIVAMESLKTNIRVKFSADDVIFQVEGLEEIEDINPFDYVTVNFSGTSPNVEARISYDRDSNKKISSISASLSQTDKISIGDEITLTIDAKGDDVTKEYGYILKETEKTIKCEGVDVHVKNISEITDEAKESFLKLAMDPVEAYLSADDIKYDDIEYEGMYMLSAVEGGTSASYAQIVLSVVVEEDYHDLAPIKVYIPVRISDIIINAEGEIEYSNNVILPGRKSGVFVGFANQMQGYSDLEDMYDAIVTPNKGKYECDATETLIP